MKDTHLETYKFSNSKMSNLINISNKFYEVPLEETTKTSYSTLTKILFENAYCMQFDNSHYYVPLPIKQITSFLFEEQSKIRDNSILVNSEYEDFREELVDFQRNYKVEFEHSEGTDMIVSLTYVARKHLDINELIKSH